MPFYRSKAIVAHDGKWLAEVIGMYKKKSVNRGGRFVIFLMARTAFVTRFVTPKGIVSVIVNDGQLSIISACRFAGNGASVVMTGQLVKLIGVKVEGKAEVEGRLG